MSFGILAIGSYVPRGRLPAEVVADAHGWFQPSLKKFQGQSRSFANWDEDAITLAVEAARACLTDVDASRVTALHVASTTMPFADRSNAGLVREAIDLSDQTRITESSGSMRAASTALLDALDSESAALLVASDCLESQPASVEEITQGHAAGAVLFGEGETLAELKGSAHLHQDFVDHYRAAGEKFSYVLETRWARDAGYRQQVSDVYGKAMAEAGLDAVDHLLVAAPAALQRGVAKQLGATDAGHTLSRRVGYCGAAQPLLLLADTLSTARAGDSVALVTIGQGVDVVILTVNQSGAGAVDRETDEESNYARYLATRRLLKLDEGLRAERDNRTAQSAAWRKHEAVTAFKGGLCSACNTLQFPPSKICVSCGAEDSQALTRLADMRGTVRSFTEDWLAYTPRPPLVFGNVGFENNANVMMEFTDIAAGELSVGLPVDMRFRIKDFDDKRQFRRYFWKPVLVRETADG